MKRFYHSVNRIARFRHFVKLLLGHLFCHPATGRSSGNLDLIPYLQKLIQRFGAFISDIHAPVAHWPDAELIMPIGAMQKISLFKFQIPFGIGKVIISSEIAHRR